MLRNDERHRAATPGNRDRLALGVVQQLAKMVLGFDRSNGFHDTPLELANTNIIDRTRVPASRGPVMAGAVQTPFLTAPELIVSDPIHLLN
jgi:hypothetical protein